MKSAIFLGNCSAIIDWNSVIAEIKQQIAPTVAPMHGMGYANRVPDTIELSDEFEKTIELWNTAGYKATDQGGSVEWHMFYPDLNFDKRVVETFCNYFNIAHYKNCWISVIHPGNISPWHVDQYKIVKDHRRYHCHIGNSEMGHIFMLADDYFLNTAQGDAYVWNDPTAWHSGVNAGKTSKFLFNMY